MQTEPIDSIEKVTSTQAPESHEPTTQDGFHPAEPGLLDGREQPGSGRPLPDSFEARARSTSAVRADKLEETTCPLSGQVERITLPGERISAYENATTPTVPQSMGFKVIKRSGPSSGGASLPDCPNGL